jgi:hypothetical protein
MMKKISSMMIIIVVLGSMSVQAQEVDSTSFKKDTVNEMSKPKVKVSGSVSFLSMTNSTLTGGYFSQNPALRGIITVSYKDFSFTVMRNSDLLDPTSGANVFAFIPEYSKRWGKYSLTASIEVDQFDHTKELNLIAPSVAVARKGAVDVDVLLCYARTFTSNEDIYIARGSVAKSYQGFTFRAYAWYVNWGGDKVSFAGEISKEVFPNVKVSVFGHLNNVNTSESKVFGAIRIGYNF